MSKNLFQENKTGFSGNNQLVSALTATSLWIELVMGEEVHKEITNLWDGDSTWTSVIKYR